MLILVNILSLNEEISFGIKHWLNESVNNQNGMGASLIFCEPIINHIVRDSNVLFVSILFNTSKLILAISIVDYASKFYLARLCFRKNTLWHG